MGTGCPCGDFGSGIAYSSYNLEFNIFYILFLTFEPHIFFSLHVSYSIVLDLRMRGLGILIILLS